MLRKIRSCFVAAVLVIPVVLFLAFPGATMAQTLNHSPKNITYVPESKGLTRISSININNTHNIVKKTPLDISGCLEANGSTNYRVIAALSEGYGWHWSANVTVNSRACESAIASGSVSISWIVYCANGSSITFGPDYGDYTPGYTDTFTATSTSWCNIVVNGKVVGQQVPSAIVLSIEGSAALSDQNVGYISPTPTYYEV